MFNSLIVQANKGHRVVVHERFPVKNCAVHKATIELVVLERHRGFICKGNRDSSFINSSRNGEVSYFLHRGQLYFCRSAHIVCIPYFPYYKPSQTIIYGFVLYLWYQQVWT